MTNFSRQIASVQRQIKRKGQSVIWRKIARNANVNQPWKGTDGAPQDNAVFILFLKGGLANAAQSLLNNTDVTEGAPDALMAGGLSFTPEMTDVVIQNGVTLAIAKIDKLAPDGTAILYYLRFQ